MSDHWSKRTSEFPIKFNIKLVHYASWTYQIIFNLCFCLVSNILLPRGEETLWHIPEKLLITKALSLNKSNKAWLNTNLAKTMNLFTTEFQELLQIFWETYRFNSWELFTFTCFHTLHLQKVAFYMKQDFSASGFPQPTLSTVECSRGYSIYFSLWNVILNWLAATKRAWTREPWNWGKKDVIHMYL